MKRFLRQHLVLDHNFPEEQAIAEVSAIDAASRVNNHQAPTPTLSMREPRHFGLQFGSNGFAVPNPPVINSRQSLVPMMGGGSVHSAGLARSPAQPSSGPSQLFGQQLPSTVLDYTTTASSYTGLDPPFGTGSAQHTIWGTGYPAGSMEVDYPSPNVEDLDNDEFAGDGGAPSDSADAVNRHIYGHDAPFAFMNYE